MIGEGEGCGAGGEGGRVDCCVRGSGWGLVRLGGGGGPNGTEKASLLVVEGGGWLVLAG